MTVHDREPLGPSERLLDPRTPGIAFLAVCAAVAAAMFSPGSMIVRIVGVVVVAVLTVVITTRSLARWRDRRFQPIFGALICAAWGVVILGAALWIKIA